MLWFTQVFRSTVGKKAVMAVTGIILFGFVFVHMVGNLKLYESAEIMNQYGRFLRTVGYPALPHGALLWVARGVLLAAAALHIWSAWQLTLLSRAARPVAYAVAARRHTSYAARTMRWGGVIILLFIVYHLLHFTTGHVHPDFVEGEPYHNVAAGLRMWWVAAFYIVAQVALGFHLYHGVWSFFQSLGINHPRYNAWRSGLAHAFAWIVTLGNISYPVAVLTGLVR
jgi:succinate dehydrogenase / fumarate reductase cytochrome b subunit